MKFTILVQAQPVGSQGSETALRFARATLASGHQITRIFFYNEGVQSANALALAPQDERCLPDEWQAFLSSTKIDAVVCIAAAIRRGIVNSQEAQRYGKQGSNLIAGAELSGLGQLIAASLESDRVITFGGHG